MPTNRTPINRPPRSQITPRAVALFKRALEIEACDDNEFWEDDGGRKREYLDVADQLHQALGLKPYEPSPLDCDGEPPSWEGHPELWRKAAELRKALIETMG